MVLSIEERDFTGTQRLSERTVLIHGLNILIFNSNCQALKLSDNYILCWHQNTEDFTM
jgi:hypothetical protein